ncbi:MAG: hypothetical protein SPK59_01885, partial [Eubacteriales bacterium]|nr:hypothetical protein [Eubacteriales bacterium]
NVFHFRYLLSLIIRSTLKWSKFIISTTAYKINHIDSVKRKNFNEKSAVSVQVRQNTKNPGMTA